MDRGEERRMAGADFFISVSNVQQRRLEVDADKAIFGVLEASDA